MSMTLEDVLLSKKIILLLRWGLLFYILLLFLLFSVLFEENCSYAIKGHLYFLSYVVILKQAEILGVSFIFLCIFLLLSGFIFALFGFNLCQLRHIKYWFLVLKISGVYDCSTMLLMFLETDIIVFDVEMSRVHILDELFFLLLKCFELLWGKDSS